MRPVPSRRVRIASPVVVAGLIALGVWLPRVTAGATPTPDLPSLTPAQLIAKVEQAHVPGLSGSVTWTANLGLPDLSGVTSGRGPTGFDYTSLLSGSHTIEVWDAGANQQRLALPTTMAEVDFVRNGNQAWYYDSSTDKVTHLVPANGGSPSKPSPHPADASRPALTPDQMAQKLLDHLTPSTSVTMGAPTVLARGHSAYQLVLSPAAGAPGAASTTVRQIVVAVDAATAVPLQVTVDAKGQSQPALQVGFHDVTFKAPAPSEFNALTGSTTVTKTVAGSHGNPSDAAQQRQGTGEPTVSGPPWGQIVTFPSAHLSAQATKELSQVTNPVSGSFGTARLLQTNVASALFLPDGKVLAGFVTPAALEAAAGSGS